MVEKEKEKIVIEKEVHKTEFVEKELPKIYFEDSKIEGYDKGRMVTISVSDKSSEEALKTFEKIRKELK